jgi:hypothetical protein
MLLNIIVVSELKTGAGIDLKNDTLAIISAKLINLSTFEGNNFQTSFGIASFFF